MTVNIADRLVCQPDIRQKRGSTPALQNAGAKANPQELPPAFGLPRCSGAFRPACRALLWLALLAHILLAAPLVEAATRTWSGGAPLLNTWSIAANWSGGVAPVAGDNLVFPLGAARMTNRNDFPPGTAFGSITFQRGGYVVTGNALSPGSINASHVAGTTTFLPDLELANALTLNASGLNPTLVVSNLFAGSFDVTVSGSGNVTMVGEMDVDEFTDFLKTGSGQLTLEPDRTIFMNATVTIDEGSVWLLAVFTSEFVVNSGGTLRGDNYLGSLISNGGIIAPGTEETGSIFAFDSIVFDAATHLQLRLNSRFDYDNLGLSLTTPTSLTLGSSQLDLDVAPGVEVGEIFAIVDANNAGSVITGQFAGHSEGSRFTENGFTFEITYQGGEHANSVLLTVVDVPPTGVTRTWDGGGTNANWSTPANWVGNVAPTQGDDLVFPAGAARATNVNNFSSGWTFNSIIFTGSNYVTSGFSVIALRAGMTNSPASGTNHFACPLMLLRNQSIRCLDVDAELEVAGNIDGDGNTLTFAGTGGITFSGNFTDSGSIVKNGSGRLTLAGNNTATNGTLTLNDGTVWVNGAYTNLTALNLNGATLGGFGAVSALTSVGGLIRPGNGGPGILNLGDEADATFDGATVFEVQLQGTVPGTEHDQLRQTGSGAIDLGGSTLQVTFPTAPLVGDSFTILQAFGNAPRVTGTFNGLPEGGELVVSGLHLRITYRGRDGNDVVLTAVYQGPTGITREWDGGGINGNWTAPANWVGDIGPGAGDDLVFPAGAARPVNTNLFPAGTAFNSITFRGSNYAIYGNEILLGDGVANSPVSGSNVLAGDFRLQTNATFRLGPSSLLELAGVVDNDGNELIVSGAGSGVANGQILGAGRLIKLGSGTLALISSNNYSGLTLVSNGVLVVTHPRALGLAGADTLVTTGAVLRVQGGVRLPESLQLAGALWSEGGVNELAGGATLLETNVTLRVEAGAELLMSGPLLGTGGFIKTGTGRMTTEGPQPFSGKAAVQAGTLFVNGVHSNSVITLDGGLLGGVGFAGSVRGLNGVLSPGASPGRLRADDVRLEASTAFDVEINGAAAGSGYDQLEVNGVVTLVNAALRFSRTYVPAASDRFMIINNRGADQVFGTFLGLPERAVFTNGTITFEITYLGGDGNDVVLSRLAPPPPPCPEPVLSIRQLTNEVELSWPSCPSNFYQLAWTTNFTQWQMLTPPLAAPETNSGMTWTTPTSLPHQFFQLVVRPLTNSPMPTNSGIYPGRTFTHGGITRTYRLNIPESYTNGRPAPLMLALHGHNQTADSFAGNIPNLSTYANEAGVILVFPSGTDDQNGTGWNILPPSPQNPVDDAGFLLALIDELDESLNIDRKRIYAGGFSNGGQMCHRLAARTTNVFAAFAAVGSAVAGTFGTDTLIYQPPPLEPNSILIVNATNDCKRPFWGGTNVDGSLQPPARDSMTHWTNANFCTPSPVITTNVFVTNHINRVFADCGGPYPPFNSPRTNLVIREHYQLTCAPGTEVLFVTLTDGGHAWVEAADNVGFDTSREVLSFFLRHCRCDTLVAAEPLVIPTAPGQYELSLCDQSYSRLFRLQVPAGYNPAVAAPLAFVFHGGQQTVAEFSAQHPGLYTKANLENMLLVLPQATVHPGTGGTLWGDRPFDTVVDDVSFVTNLLEHLDAALNVDRLRLYGAGFSSGGEFCHWMAGTTTGLLAAIAPVCAQTGWNEPDRNGPTVTPPPPLEPIAVLMVRGGVDPKRPFNGGANIDGVLCRSAADDVAYWVSGNTCVGAPVITAGAGVMRWEHSACAGTTEVILVRVDALGHAWPDAAPFNANVQVIDFLLLHSR